MAKFRFDPNSTVNEGRHRLISPKRCMPKTYFRRRSTTPGVSYVMCQTKKEKPAVHQSIRFSKKIWTETKAGKWWQKNKSKFIKRSKYA